jgi:hypothetical protein
VCVSSPEDDSKQRFVLTCAQTVGDVELDEKRFYDLHGNFWSLSRHFASCLVYDHTQHQKYCSTFRFGVIHGVSAREREALEDSHDPSYTGDGNVELVTFEMSSEVCD